MTRKKPKGSPWKTDREDRLDREDREREVPFSSVKEAALLFQDEFRDVPVKHSLTLLVEQKGKEALTESYCREWLTREHRRKKPHSPAKQYFHEEPPVNAELIGPTPTEEEVRAMSDNTIRPFLEQMRKGIRNGAEEAK